MNEWPQPPSVVQLMPHSYLQFRKRSQLVLQPKHSPQPTHSFSASSSFFPPNAHAPQPNSVKPLFNSLTSISSAAMTNAASPPSLPHNVIHSVPTPVPDPVSQPVPAIHALSDITSETSTPRSKLFSIFSPRNASTKPPTPLRRIFSPASYRRTAPIPTVPDSASPAPALAPTSPRRRFGRIICPCLSPFADSDDSLQEFDYGQQFKNLQPTYEPSSPLLPNPLPSDEHRICLVLDLDETLVHSSFTPITDADFEIPLDMQGEVHTVYVKKRPGVDNFLKKASEWYEIVMFTASLALYANPVMDLLDPHNLVQLRLYREHCVLIGGCYVKDIEKLGRDLKRTFIIDNSPLSYVFQPENAIPITAFFTDENDRELEKTLALLEQARHLKDVRKAFS